jgi:hypothetical protein
MNSFKVVEQSLSAEVVQGGTFTINYPEDTSRGSFINGKNHKMMANQTLFSAPNDFTISFGASSATITYNGTTPLAANSRVAVQLDIGGEDIPEPYQNLLSGAVTALYPFLLNLGSPDAADDDYFATALEAEATAQAHGVDDLLQTDMPDGIARNIVLTGTAGSNHVVTVVGEDIFGAAMEENITLSGTSAISGVKAFAKVSAFDAAAGAAGDTFKAGFGNALGLPVFVGGPVNVLAELQDNTIIGGPSDGPVRLNWNADQVSVLAGTAAAIELIAPCAGVITRLTAAVRVAVGTGGTVTAKVGTTDVDGLSLTIANSATKGTTATDTPTSGHASTVVAKGDRIQIVFDDAFASTGALDGFIEIRPTGLKSGTLVNGLSPLTKATATNADVRGTYTPENAPDGTIGYALLVQVPDPSFLGNAQYAG